MAHDLRNPLAAISLAASVLDSAIKADKGDEASILMIRTLHRNVGRLEALVANVLEKNANLISENGTSLERRHFALWALVEAVVRSMRPVTEKSGRPGQPRLCSSTGSAMRLQHRWC